ncbi:DNA primase [Nitrospira sp. Kam-Ns4a]
MTQGLIPQDIIELIRERTDIAEVVSGYVTLTRAGQNLKGLCPFHSEKTPSFNVSPSRQIFHCFGCGVGGNVFTFLMKIEGKDFPEAVRELGRRAGIAVPEQVQGERTAGAGARERERLHRINEAAAGFFHQALLDPAAGREALAYLTSRGIQRQTIEAFQLGLAPPGWDGLLTHLTKEGYAPAEVSQAGLAVPKEPAGRGTKAAAGYYDRFRARLMFPIRDLRSRVIGFGGRVLGEGMPKYLNSPDSPLFQKGRCLYALDRAREAAARLGTLVIVEGYVDAITLHQSGLTHVAATLGTALTPEHLRLLRRLVTKVVLLFDPDAAGVRAALRTLDLFVGSGLGVRVVSLPDGQDPDEFVRARGPEAFLRLEERAPSLLDFAVEHALRSAGADTIEERIRGADAVLRIIQKASDRLEQEEYLRRVAERLGVNQQRLIERYPALRERERRGAQSPGRPPAAAPVAAPAKGRRAERDLVHLLLQGKLGPAQVRALNPEAFTDPAYRRIVELALGRLDRDGRVLVAAVLAEAVPDPRCGPVATELSLLDGHYDDVAAHVAGCLETLERTRREELLEELIVRLRAAEREGRTEDATRLRAQLNELRLRKAVRPSAVQTIRG